VDLAVRDQDLTLRVGGVALVLLLALGVLLVAFDGYKARSGFVATVYFAHVGGLHEGADVQVAGQLIGRISAISLVPAHRTDSGHPLHPGGGIAAIVRIDPRYRHMAPINGEYFISAKGVIGERFIEIGAPPGDQPPGRLLQAGDEVRGIDPPRLDRVLIRSYRNFQVSRQFVEAIKPEAREFLSALRDLAATLAELEAEPRAAPGAVPLGVPVAGVGAGAPAGPSGAAPWSELIAELGEMRDNWDATELTPAVLARLAVQTRQVAERVSIQVTETQARVAVVADELIALRRRLPGGERFAHLRAALAQAQASVAKVGDTLASVEELIATIRRGQGTIGALLFDPEFPEDAKALGRMLKRHPWRLIGRPGR
jgi:phospholipid/cholesterol/gamma-HCH transport system substrate-binding protein